MSTNDRRDEFGFSFDAIQVRRIGRAGISVCNQE